MVLALLALVATKFVAILSPILQAWAVDDLAGSGVPEFALGAIGLTVAYGMARIATNGFLQLRDALFAKVAQRRDAVVDDAAQLRLWPQRRFLRVG